MQLSWGAIPDIGAVQTFHLPVEREHEPDLGIGGSFVSVAIGAESLQAADEAGGLENLGAERLAAVLAFFGVFVVAAVVVLRFWG